MFIKLDDTDTMENVFISYAYNKTKVWKVKPESITIFLSDIKISRRIKRRKTNYIYII